MKHRTRALKYIIDKMFKTRSFYENANTIYFNETEETINIEDLSENEWEPDPQIHKNVTVVELKSEEWPKEEQGSWLGVMREYAEIYNFNKRQHRLLIPKKDGRGW